MSYAVLAAYSIMKPLSEYNAVNLSIQKFKLEDQ